MTESDHASIQAQVESLRRAVDELSLLNELAVAIGAARDVDEIIHTLVRRSLGAVGAEQGVVSLVRPDDLSDAHTLVRTSVGKASDPLRPDETLLGWMGHRKQALVLNDPRAHETFGRLDWDPSVRSVLCVPLVAHGRFLGVLTLYNKTDGGFTDADARLLTILGMQSAQVIDSAQAAQDRDRVLNLFGRHTAPAVVEELLRYDTDPPTRRTRACVMFMDVRGFTQFSEHAEPEAVVEYLNTLFEISTPAVTRHSGIIHQLLGDGFMAIFGAPLATPDDCTQAVDAALEIVEGVEAAVEAGRLVRMDVGIGLHAGEVVAGTVGSPQHKEYKVTGDVVNVAARIEQLNKTYGSQLLITGAVQTCLPAGRHSVEALGPVSLRGRADPLELYRLA